LCPPDGQKIMVTGSCAKSVLEKKVIGSLHAGFLYHRTAAP